jgi:hypothetical protein
MSVNSKLLTEPLLLAFERYAFTLPDMVGGNAYFGQKPSHELMVRHPFSWIEFQDFVRLQNIEAECRLT